MRRTKKAVIEVSKESCFVITKETGVTLKTDSFLAKSDELKAESMTILGQAKAIQRK
jgi:hypothetical protein